MKDKGARTSKDGAHELPTANRQLSSCRRFIVSSWLGCGSTRWHGMAVLLLAGAAALLIAAQPIDFLVRHLKDDSYYYFRTANHIVLGDGPTFDGISLTNGFHPLWMLNLLPIYGALPHAPLLALRAVVLLLALYHTITAWLLFRAARAVAGSAHGVLVAVAWALCPFVLRISFSGMEAALYGVVLCGLTWLLVARFKDTAGHWQVQNQPTRVYAGAGVLAGLCVLARLDAVYLLVGVAATLGATLLRRRGLRAALPVLLALAVPVVALVGPYLLYNWRMFGQIVPVSGVIKRVVWPGSLAEWSNALLWPLGPLAGRTGLPTVVVGGMLVAVLALTVAVGAPLRAAVVPVLRRYDWLWIGAALLYAHMSLSRSFIANWYYVPFALLLALAGGEMVVRLARQTLHARARRWAATGALVLLAASYGVVAHAEFNPRKNDQVYATYQAALWLRANLPPDAIGGAWNSGVLAYFSERQVMNLDGLINSYQYLAAMQQGRDAAFAVGHGVRYVFDMYPLAEGQPSDFLPGPQWQPFLTPLYEQRFTASNVGLSSFFQTVFVQPRRDATFVFKVWRVGADH